MLIFWHVLLTLVTYCLSTSHTRGSFFVCFVRCISETNWWTSVKNLISMTFFFGLISSYRSDLTPLTLTLSPSDFTGPQSSVSRSLFSRCIFLSKSLVVFLGELRTTNDPIRTFVMLRCSDQFRGRLSTFDFLRILSVFHAFHPSTRFGSS